MKKKREFKVKNAFGIVLIIIVVAVFIVLISTRQEDIQKNQEEVEKISTMDLASDYPKSPREVVTLYSRIIKCLYNEDYTDDEFKLIVEHMRALFDEELLDKNPYNTHLDNIRADVASYKNKGKTMISYMVENADKIEYVTLSDGLYYAKINSEFDFKDDENGKTITNQQFVLRRDSDGQWKILYWTPYIDKNE